MNYPTYEEVKASYSADEIMHLRIRRPFKYLGVSCMIAGGYHIHVKTVTYSEEMETYAVIPINEFKGPLITTYMEKLEMKVPPELKKHPKEKIEYAGEYARRDPKGFYYGMYVQHGGKEYVIGRKWCRFFLLSHYSESKKRFVGKVIRVEPGQISQAEMRLIRAGL